MNLENIKNNSKVVRIETFKENSVWSIDGSVNEWLVDHDVDVLDIRFCPLENGYYAAHVIYKLKE